MYYGDEKALQMSRSLLPSKRRKSARWDKRHINKKTRHKVKQALGRITCAEDWDEENLGFDYWDDGNHEKSMMIWERRAADKVEPFIRWAKAKAAHIPDGEKLDYIRSILPGSGFIIIDHALSHLKWVDGFNNDTYRYGRWYWRNRYGDRPHINRNELIRILGEIVQDRKAHAIFNDVMRKFHKLTYWYRFERVDVSQDWKTKQTIRKNIYRSHDKSIGPRILEGIFDIEDFVSDVSEASWVDKTIPATGNFCGGEGSNEVNNPDYHPEWKRAVKLFVDVWFNNPEDYEAMKRIDNYENYESRWRYYAGRWREEHHVITVIRHTKWTW